MRIEFEKEETESLLDLIHNLLTKEDQVRSERWREFMTMLQETGMPTALMEALLKKVKEWRRDPYNNPNPKNASKEERDPKEEGSSPNE